MNRREFLTTVTGGVAAAGVAQAALPAYANEPAPGAFDDQVGVLCDTTKCIGCRKCELACARENRGAPVNPAEFNDTSVLDTPRRMSANDLTVVNRYPNPTDPEHPVFVKVQCMHCLHPCCVSACIVGALHREPNGSVSYDASKCIGCRYCMLACPFEVPAYEYSNILTPRVRKCTFCYDTMQARGEAPACVQMCPTNVFTFAKRKDLIKLAHEKIAETPDAYHDHVYGETEAGGTSWLYLTSRPATELGMLNLPAKPVPELTETIQHSIFKYGIPPVLLYGLLSIAMKVTASDDHTEAGKEEKS